MQLFDVKFTANFGTNVHYYTDCSKYLNTVIATITNINQSILIYC